MKNFRILFIFTLVFLSYSCATIFLGRYQKVNVKSYPNGANIFVNGIDTKMITPCIIKVKRKQPGSAINRKNELVYVLKKDNYFDGEYRDMSKANFFSIYGWIYILPGAIDMITGASRVYSEVVTLKLNEFNKVIMKTDTIIKKELVYINNSKSNSYKFEKISDVDKEIPQIGRTNPNRFALIIGNEDYSSHQMDLSSEINVDFARNDASAFMEYAINILGIPERNVFLLLDATTGQINQKISKMNLIIKNTQGNAEIFFYYAGHGLPDEQTKEPYLMPVDVSGKNANEGIKLKDLYFKLAEYPSKRITVFIDACFSGGARNQGLLAARGVKIKPKEEMLKGNMVVFAASSGEQSSLPLKEKQHGIFTYYLLKKLQESKGDVSYSELSKYIKENVSLQSVIFNSKEQTPQINVSNSIIDEWGSFELK
jgi:hypothetical protein